MENIILTQTTRTSLVNEITLEVLTGIEELLKTQRHHTTKTPDYLSRKEVSQLFKVSLVTISDWQKKGILQPYKIGTRVRFKKDEVMAALRQMETLKR